MVNDSRNNPRRGSRRSQKRVAPPPIASNVRELVAAQPIPVRVDRRTAAELVTARYFKVSYRTLEDWPVSWRRLNGRAHCETKELFKVAQAKLDEAAETMGGRRRA